jgi:hypothetical protein
LLAGASFLDSYLPFDVFALCFVFFSSPLSLGGFGIPVFYLFIIVFNLKKFPKQEFFDAGKKNI